MDTSKVKGSQSLARTLNGRMFDPEKFANSINKESDGDKDLRESRHRVQQLGDETAKVLKQQVYKNYQLFIDTAKEIRYLETEMKSLNDILTEQRTLMDSMTKTFASNDHTVVDDGAQEKRAAQMQSINKEEQQRAVMKALLAKVDGCQTLLELPTRYLVFNGDVTELNVDTFKSIEKIHMLLFNDILILAKCNTARRGKPYKFETSIDIDKFALANFRDIQTVRNAFKILEGNNVRMFQCESLNEKKQWIAKSDQAKRDKIQGKMDSEKPKPAKISFEATLTSDEKIQLVKREEAEKSRQDLVLREILREFFDRMEDLEVFIAQRNFEEAVELILELKLMVVTIEDATSRKDSDDKLTSRVDQLVDILCGELKTSPDRSLRRGAAVLRRPVRLLIRLDQLSKACSLFLKNRSGAIEFALQQLRTEGSLTLFINKLSKLFFTFLQETATEFEVSFSEVDGCFSSFTVWLKTEMKQFVEKLAAQVFCENTTDITDVAECVYNAQLHSSQLKTHGMELNFLLNSLLLRHIQASLKDHRQKIVDATKLRNSDEKWRPVNMKTPQAADRLVEEMKKLGLGNFADFRYEGCFFHLTHSTLSFVKALLSHVDVCAKMVLPELLKAICDGIIDIVTCFTVAINDSLSVEMDKQKVTLIKSNAKFIAMALLPLVESKLKEKLSTSPKELEKIRISMLKLK